MKRYLAKNKLYILIFISSIILILIAGIFVPKILALMHQQQGGRLMSAMMKSNDRFGYSSLACDRRILIPEDKIHIRKSITHFKSSQNYDKGLSHAYFLMGQAYCLLGEYENAIQSYLMYTELRPENPLGFVELGFAYDHLGNRDTALMMWSDAGLSSNHFYEVGDQYLDTQNYDEALIWYEIAAQHDSDWVTYWQKSAYLYKEQELWEEVIVAYQNALEINPTNGDIWYELGQTYEVIGDWESALNIYQEGLHVGSGPVGFSDFYFRIGFIFQHLVSPPDLKSAWEAYELALEFNNYATSSSQKATTYHQRGQILASKGIYEEAILEFQKSLQIIPNYYWSNFQLAKVYNLMGENDKAIEFANQAIVINPDIKNVYRLLGDIFVTEGNVIEAKRMYRKVLEIDPNDEGIQEILETLNSRTP
jgi:tetratricopeptide (TPR) repeat protein